MPGDEKSWQRRAEIWAAVGVGLTLAAAIAFIVGKVYPAALLAALAVSIGIVTILAARLERQVLTRRAEQAEADAKEAKHMERRVLSVLNHDLAQPLHAISLYHSALRKRVETDDARGVLDKAEASAQAMSAMLDAMSELNRVNAALEKPLIETFDLQAALADLPITAPETKLRVQTDRALLSQAFLHLARNAEQHGGGGRVEITEDDDEVEIAIVDDGAGIAREDQQRVFEPFERLAGARSGNGLGVGLTLARRIADTLNLRLNVRSEPDKGARFTLRVPLAS